MSETDKKLREAFNSFIKSSCKEKTAGLFEASISAFTFFKEGVRVGRELEKSKKK